MNNVEKGLGNYHHMTASHVTFVCQPHLKMGTFSPAHLVGSTSRTINGSIESSLPLKIPLLITSL